jgi:hypothetical protein
MLRDNSQRARTAIILFWVFFATTAISIGSTYLEYSLLQRALTQDISINEATANDTRQKLIGVVEILVHVVVIVYFIMWFRRAYYNLHSLGCYVRYTEGWAAGAWFVPFLNLVRPFQIMKEIWDRTQERAQEGTENPRIESSVILGFWWFLWIATNIAANIYTRLVFGGDHDVRDLIALDKTAIIISAIDLINVLLIITIIKKISGFEEKLKDVISIENIASGQPAPEVVTE